MGITAEPHKPPEHLLYKSEKSIQSARTKKPHTKQTSTQAALACLHPLKDTLYREDCQFRWV